MPVLDILQPASSLSTYPILSLRTHAYSNLNLGDLFPFPIQLASINSKLAHSPITVLPLSILSAVISIFSLF